MTLTWIRWKDALTVEGDHHPPTAELAILEEVGFLLDENDEAVLIGMESENDTPGRFRINIPKNQILERRDNEWQKAFPKKSIVH